MAYKDAYVGTMEVGSALMNVIYLVDPVEFDTESGWMTVDYLYRVTEDDGRVSYDPLPNNGAAKKIRLRKSKMLATSPAAPNINSMFLDVIGYRESNPDDVSLDLADIEEEDAN